MLIEDGKLVNYMQDRQNARLMSMEATGNGRRRSYAHAPMPRMTNTYMLSGDKTPEEIIASMKKESMRFPSVAVRWISHPASSCSAVQKPT